ncbi:hypothetical protein EVAR_89407_1 [Eumeta japonica]|uniref:Uncharacterized protein n=1 Tax=Eumeta variegata TaxID=151549 RepID=A0A4C1XTN2_EUMVA|nr:hypothetical protein EVAR_89407_1 [Eumeta japonica]
MDGKERVRLSGAEYRKRAKEKDDKQKITIQKTRKLDDFFGKPSTDIKGPTINPTLYVPSSSGAPSADDSGVSSSENILIDVASISKEQAEDVPLVPGVAVVGVQPYPPDQELYEISDDPAKWTIDEFTRDHICKNGANQNIQNDFPKSERIYEDKARQLSRHLFERQLLNGEAVRAGSTGSALDVYCSGGGLRLTQCVFIILPCERDGERGEKTHYGTFMCPSIQALTSSLKAAGNIEMLTARDCLWVLSDQHLGIGFHKIFRSG